MQWHSVENRNKNSKFPYLVKTQDVVTPMQYREMVSFCNETFGKGGHMPESDSIWFVSIQRDTFAFQNKDNMLLFYVAFCG